MTNRFSASSSDGSTSKEPCSCGHDYEDHESAGDGMLPLCFFCGCTGWRRSPNWVRRLRRDSSE